MTIVKILRDLWRVRVLVVVVALVALVIATLVAYRPSFPAKLESRRYDVGLATTRLLVDTPSSQVINVAPRGSETLGARANLLANLMVDGVFKAAIAQQAGLRPNELMGISPDDAVNGQATSTPSGRHANVLTTRVLSDVNGDELPVIEIDTQAPDAARAGRIANAAIAGVRGYLADQAASEQVPATSRLRVTGLGAAQASDVTRGPSRLLALLIAILAFATGCAGILGVLAFVRAWRASPEDDDSGSPDNGGVTALPRPALTDTSRSMSDDGQRARTA